MSSEGNSFLPRILSVFYAVFHDRGGTNIVYQVPEGLIVTPPNQQLNASVAGNANRTSSSDKGEGPSTTSSGSREPGRADLSRTSSSSRYTHLANSRDTLGSSFVRSSSANRCLFKFEDFSRYVIPPSALCGRLVTCTTRRHQIIGFPVELYNEERYERNFFRYNVCFVFERTADLSCYEPIVRKIGRVLTTCEEESSFLSSPETSHKIHAVLEQLFEDLNSYSETSIPIDKFNSIELKIFPFYPNPPDAHDWDVPVALINLKKRIEDNWDLTMAKVCQYIDGTNHVSRIAYLADCDLDLTRKAIQHLLFYQVIMMIDIFQFSNMYTLCRSVAWLAVEEHVRYECGPYVTRPDREISEWPDLLHLYSRLKPGITVFEWMHEYDTHKHGIDPRRFVSFGVIKGFLRRVHRWPVLLQVTTPDREKERRSPSASLGRRRGKSLSMPGGPSGPVVGPSSSGPTSPPIFSSAFSYHKAKDGQQYPGAASGTPTGAVGNAGMVLGRHPSVGEADKERIRSMRRASAAEKYLEQFRRELDRSREGGGSGAVGAGRTSPNIPLSSSASAVAAAGSGINTSPRTQRYSRTSSNMSDGRSTRKNSLVQQQQAIFGTSNIIGIGSGGVGSGNGGVSGLPPRAGGMNPFTSSFASDLNALANGESSGSGLATPTATRPRLSRSPSSQATIIMPSAYSASSAALNLNLSSLSGGGGTGTPITAGSAVSAGAIPSGLKELLDGTHHADELGVRFELGWPALEKHLVAIGSGRGDGDFGRVEIIYR